MMRRIHKAGWFILLASSTVWGQGKPQMPLPIAPPTLPAAPAPAPTASPTTPTEAPASPAPDEPTPENVPASSAAMEVVPSTADKAPLLGTTGQPSEVNNQQLQMSLGQLDHPSGIYYARETAKAVVWVDNPGTETLVLKGNIAFGEVADTYDEKTGRMGIDVSGFKKITVTPLVETKIPGRKRAKIEVSGLVGPPGRYEFRWEDKRILSVAGLEVRCIYPPHAAGKGDAEETPTPKTGGSGVWIARMPRAAAGNNGYLADYAQRTGINRFVIEDDWPMVESDTADHHGLFGGALALTAAEFQTLLQQAQQAKVQIILRVNLGEEIAGQRDANSLAAFHEHLANLLKLAGKTVQAVVVHLPLGNTKIGRGEAASYYLATYDAAKRHNKNIVMLGLGSATTTKRFLLETPPGQQNLAPYVDALGTEMRYGELWRINREDMREFLRQHAVYILPPPPPGLSGKAGDWEVSPALALGQIGVGAEGLNKKNKPGEMTTGLRLATVPVPDLDRGVTLHLFGEAVFDQRVDPDLPPFMAVFQGDGYAVAAIAGLGAGAPNDLDWPSLSVSSRGTMEVVDDAQEMRVVDERGHEVPCRAADILRIPLDSQVRYLLASGTAEDLAALLHAADIKNMPQVEISQVQWVASDATHDLPLRLQLRLRNATRRTIEIGELKVYLVPTNATEANQPLATDPMMVGRRGFKDLAANDSQTILVNMSKENLSQPEGNDDTHPLNLRVEVMVGKETQVVLLNLPQPPQ